MRETGGQRQATAFRVFYCCVLHAEIDCFSRGSYRDGSMDGGRDRRHSGSPGRSRSMSPRSPGAPGDGDDLGSAQNVADIAKKTAKVWDGGLILKNSLFPTKLHLMEGNRR